MKETENQNKTAGANEQNLPDRPELAGSPDNSTTFLVERPRPARSATYAPASQDWANAPAAAPFHRATAVEASDFSSVNAVANVERLQRLINDEVKVIKQLKPDSLAVVLKPDGDTEILLQVHTHNGQIEAHARCERGNFGALNSQWSQLQQSLAAQGVRLMPLTEAASSGALTAGSALNANTDTSNGGGNGQQARGNTLAQDNESGPIARASGQNKPAKTNSRSSRGREWWA